MLRLLEMCMDCREREYFVDVRIDRQMDEGLSVVNADTTIVILTDLNPPNTTVTLLSDVITIFASNELIGQLSIVFQIGIQPTFKDGQIQCVFLTNSTTEEWSTDGITTVIGINRSVECTTNHLTTFAILFSSVQCGRYSSEISGVILLVTSYTLLAISLLFLIASVVIFILSGKKFFSIDINVLHFNHTVSLLLAICCFILLVQSASDIYWLYSTVAFFLQFLWTNVFLSSLSIGILVFYSIWVVSLKHIARRLYKFLIPIGWCVSFAWALVWLVYGKLTNQYLPLDTHNELSDIGCEYSCVLSSEKYLHFTFLVPVYAILLSNASILCLCLYKIRSAFKNRDRAENELSRLRRVSIGGILLIPALSIPFIIALPLSLSRYNDSLHTVFEWAYIIANAPIGIIHFMVITYQIPETRIPKFLPSKTPQKPSASVTESTTVARDTIDGKPTLHFNVVRPTRSETENSTVYGNDWAETKL